jgi:hypothetical protein
METSDCDPLSTDSFSHGYLTPEALPVHDLVPLAHTSSLPAMANFPVRPWLFLEGADDIEAGPADRLQRNMMVVDDPPLLHEEYALVFINPQVPDHQRQYFLEEICRVLREDYNYEVSNPEIYPCCVGLIAFEDAVIRDRMVRDSPHALDEDYTFSLVKHDEGPNMRQPVFEYEAWVMMLSFPLDYQTDHYVNKAVSLFGKLLIWHRPRVKKSRVLVKVFINEVALVPRSLVVKRIYVLGGIGRSWTVPIYILNGRHTNSLLVSTEEAAPPLNASPHPFSLPYLTVAQQHHLDVQAWQQQQVDLTWMGNAQAS